MGSAINEIFILLEKNYLFVILEEKKRNEFGIFIFMSSFVEEPTSEFYY
jgi:hypothetical protein